MEAIYHFRDVCMIVGGVFLIVCALQMFTGRNGR